MSTRSRQGVIFAAAVFALGGNVCAQIPEDEIYLRPASAQRLVKLWDFEDPLYDLKEVPDHWYRYFHEPQHGHQSRFPTYNLAAFSTAHAAAGETSVALPVRGASTRLSLASGVVPAMPGAKYLCSASLLTEDFQHARARVRGEFLDASMRMLEGAEASTRLTNTAGEWENVSFTVIAPDDAAWFQLHLEALQPSEYDHRERHDQAISRQDVHGVAYFDELRLYQIPQVSMTTRSPGNIVIEPEPAYIDLRMRDLAGEKLTSEMRVFDIAGNQIDATTNPVDPDGRLSSWKPAIERYGWYRASLRVANQEGIIAQQTLDFVYSPPMRPLDGEEALRFGLVLEPTGADKLPELPGTVRGVGVGSVSLPVWGMLEPPLELLVEDPDAYQELVDLTQDRLADALEDLLMDNRDVGFILQEMPRDVARDQRLDAHQTAELLARPAEEWERHLFPLLTRFGERVLRWQIGAAQRDNSPFANDTVANVAQSIQDQFYRLVPRPSIAMPWNIHQLRHEEYDPPESLTVRVPDSVPAKEIPNYITQWPKHNEIRFIIDTLDEQTFGLEAQIIDLVRKATTAWDAGAAEIAIDQPWIVLNDDDHSTAPTPALAVWRTLISELAARHPGGEIDIEDGMRAYLAAGERHGALVAWNERAKPEDAYIHAFLGSEPIKIRDVFGNAQPTQVDQYGAVMIPLQQMPVYIENVDVPLVKFRNTIRFEPEMLQARAQRHNVDLIVENPWDTMLTGSIRFNAPEGWDLYPRLTAFSIPAGGTQRIPVSIIFGLNAEAGEHVITAETKLTADKVYPPMTIPVDTELGLEELRFFSSFRYASTDGQNMSDVAVTILLTNVSDQPLSLETFAYAPDYPGQSNFLSLAPGESITNQFIFEGGADRLSGSSIRTGVRERPGTGRLNRTLEIR